MRLPRARSLLAALSVPLLLSAFLHAPPAAAAEDPHSPADRTIPAPDTWKPGKAVTEEKGGAPPKESWTSPEGEEKGSEQAAKAAEAEEELPCATVHPNQRGIQDYYPLERHQISDRMELGTNLNSGNLVLRHRDLTIRGTGLDMSLNSVYNSRGGGWQLSYGQDVGLEITGDTITFRGPSGYCEDFTPKSGGGYTSPSGLNAKLQESENGSYKVTFTKGEYEDQEWNFTPQGWLVSQTDRNGNSNRFRYIEDGVLASIVDSQDRVTTLEWDGGRTGNVTKVTDPVGATAASYAYNDANQMTSLTDRAGKKTGFAYDGDDLTEVTDTSGATWKLSHNADDRVSEFGQPAKGGAATSKYSYGDKTATVTDARGNDSTFEFDDQGRQTSATDAEGHTRSQTWTANADVASTTDALDASVTYDYDALNNIIGTKLPTGAETGAGYADSANPNKPTTVTDPDGDSLNFRYDDAGNLTRARQGELGINVFTASYNANGTINAANDANVNKTTYTYDSQGNLTTVSEPGPLGDMVFGYDSLSRVTSVTDGNGVRLDYGYDKIDRVVSVKQGGDLIQATTFDGNGNTTATHTQRATLAHTFDGRNALLKTVREDSNGSETTTYTNDKAGNLTELSEHEATTAYGYDKAHRMVELTDYTGDTTAFGYDDNDQRTKTTFPDGAVEAKTYDDSSRLTRLSLKNAADEVLTEASYSYSKSGSDSDQMQTRTVNGDKETFSYDALNRLTSNGVVDYTYDKVGNMLSAGDTEFSYNDSDQATKAGGTDLGHDNAGNLTSQGDVTAEYSATNQFTQSDKGTDLQTSVSYDTSDSTQRRGITDVKGDTRIDRQLTNTALGVSGIAAEGERTHFVRDPDGRLVSMISRDGDQRYNYTTDDQNTVLAVAADGTEAGEPEVEYTYDPYGTTTTKTHGDDTTASTLNPFTYTGVYQYQNGELAMGHRYFSPGNGQFTQADPSRQELNNYTYAQCDPVNNTDPTGLIPCAGAIALAIGTNMGMAAAAIGFGATLGATAATGGIAVPLAIAGGLTFAGSVIAFGGAVYTAYASCK